MDQDRPRLREILSSSEPNSARNLSELTNLVAAAELYERHPAPLVRLGEGCADARAASVAGLLLEFTRARGVDSALMALADFCAIKEVRTATYAYVENVTTDRLVELGDGVTALPQTFAPDRCFADAIASVRGSLNINPGMIVRAVQEESPFLKMKKPEGPTPFDGLHLRPPGIERIEIAIRMLALSGPAFPAIRARTTIIETDQLRLFRACTGTSFDYPGYLLTKVPKQISEEVRSLRAKYALLAPRTCRRVDVAIGRLSLSVAKRDPGDAIVDLAIALEALLSDKGNKGELTYRLRLRAALFLEQTLEARKFIKATVTELYTARSGIVHGELPSPTDPALLAAGEELVGRLIRKVLTLSKLPEWGDVELGAEVPA